VNEIDPEHKPSALRSKATTYNKSWHRHWAWAAFGIEAEVTIEAEAEPKTEEERQEHMRKMLDRGL
jgi:hypothetical protein